MQHPDDSRGEVCYDAQCAHCRMTHMSEVGLVMPMAAGAAVGGGGPPNSCASSSSIPTHIQAAVGLVGSDSLYRFCKVYNNRANRCVGLPGGTLGPPLAAMALHMASM